MNKIIKVITISFLYVLPVLAQVGYDRIFVVDISGSMIKDDLYKRVQKSVIDYIKDCREGDRIILMTFGSEVNPGIDDRMLYEATISRDIGALTGSVQEFKFRDDWTWMTKAFDVIGSRLRDLQKAYPDRPKRVYVFTDGLNDPPPDKKDALTFEDVLRNYSYNFVKEGTFIYVVFLDTVNMDKPTKAFFNSVDIVPVTRERGDSILYQEITFKPSKIEKVLSFDNAINLDIELEVIKMENVDEEKVSFLIGNTNFSKDVQISLSPNSFTCSSPGQKITLNLQLKGIKLPSEYRIVFKPTAGSRNIVIDPQRFPVILTLSEIVVKVTPKELTTKVNVNEQKTKFVLTFMNESDKDNIMFRLSIPSVEKGKSLKITPSEVVVNKGKKTQEFTLLCDGYQKGNYNYNVKIEGTEPQFKVEPSTILLKLTFFTPMSPMVAIIVIFLLILSIFIVFAYVRINQAFKNWILVPEELSGIPLSSYKPPFSIQITIGKDALPEIGKEVLTIYAKLVTVFTNKLYMLVKEDISEELKSNTISELKEIQIKFNNYTFEIKPKED